MRGALLRFTAQDARAVVAMMRITGGITIRTLVQCAHLDAGSPGSR
jgi:hypothetical protein